MKLLITYLLPGIPAAIHKQSSIHKDLITRARRDQYGDGYGDDLDISDDDDGEGDVGGVSGVMAEALDTDLIGVVVAAVCIGILTIVIITFLVYCCFR